MPVVVWGFVILGHAVWRSLHSGARANRWSPLTLAVLELGLGVAAVMGTGFWDSPFVFCPMTGLMATASRRISPGFYAYCSVSPSTPPVFSRMRADLPERSRR